MKDTPWDHGLRVTAEDGGLAGMLGRCCCASWPTGPG